MIQKSKQASSSSLTSSEMQLIQELTRLNQCLKTQLEKCHKYIEGLEADLKEAQFCSAERQELINVNQRYEGYIRQKQDEVEILKADLNNVYAKLKEKRHQMKQLEKTNTSLETSIIDIRKGQGNHLTQSSTVNSHYTSDYYDQSNMRLNAIVLEHRKTVEHYEKEIQSKNMVIGQIQGLLEEMGRKEKVMVDDINKLRQINFSLNHQVEELNRRLRETQRKCDEYMNAGNRLSNKNGGRSISFYSSSANPVSVITSPKDWFEKEKYIKDLERKVQSLEGNNNNNNSNAWPVTKRITAQQHQVLKQHQIQKQKLLQKLQFLNSQKQNQKHKNQKIKNDLIEIKLEYSSVISQKTKLVEENVKLERKNSELLAKLETFGTIKRGSKIVEDSREGSCSFRGLSKAHSIGSLTAPKAAFKQDGQIPVKDKNNKSPNNNTNYIYLASSFSNPNKKGSVFYRPGSYNCNLSIN